LRETDQYSLKKIGPIERQDDDGNTA